VKESISQVTSFDLFDRQPTKQEERKVKIMEASLELFARHGFENVSFDDIAKKCKVTRPLVNHYFDNKDELFELVVTFIRISYQKFVLAKMAQTRTTEAALKAYIRGAVTWVRESPDHARIWFIYFYKCAYNEKFRDRSADFVNLGYQRIQTMLSQLADEKELSRKNIPERARSLQIFLTGTIVSLVTETRSPQEQKELLDFCERRCWKLAIGEDL